MKTEVIITFDVGTSSVKALAIDAHSGKIEGIAQKKYAHVIAKGDTMELLPSEIWQSAQGALSEVLATKDFHVLAISFSWFSDQLVLCDENFEPVTNMLLYFDSRAKDTFEYFKAKNANDICKKAVRMPSPNGAAMKALWFKQNEPEIFGKARYMFDIQQFILSRIGVEPVNDDSIALFKQLEDVKNRVWAEDLMDLYELPYSMCNQRIVSCTEIIGRISRFGEVPLPNDNVPVFSGVHDEVCGIFGVGALPENGSIMSDMMGTSDCINLMENRTGNPEFPSAGVLPIRSEYGYYNVLGRGFPMLGASLEWFMREFCQNDPSEHLIETLFDGAVFDGSGRVDFIPWFGKQKVGLRGLTAATTRQDLFTALVEGLSYECMYSMQYNDDLMIKTFGKHIESVRAAGGGSQSDKWLQLRSSLFDLPILQSETPQACAVGAAVITATGLGLYDSFSSASNAMVRIGKTFEPDSAQRAAYMEREPRFKELHNFIMGI